MINNRTKTSWQNLNHYNRDCRVDKNICIWHFVCSYHLHLKLKLNWLKILRKRQESIFAFSHQIRTRQDSGRLVVTGLVRWSRAPRSSWTWLVIGDCCTFTSEEALELCQVWDLILLTLAEPSFHGHPCRWNSAALVQYHCAFLQCKHFHFSSHICKYSKCCKYSHCHEIIFSLHCTMVPLSTKSGLKSSKPRPILNGQFCHVFSKIFALIMLGSKQSRDILDFVILKL